MREHIPANPKRGGRPSADEESNFLCTQAEVAELWGVSRSRINQIERNALRKIRAGLLAELGNTDRADW